MRVPKDEHRYLVIISKNFLRTSQIGVGRFDLRVCTVACKQTKATQRSHQIENNKRHRYAKKNRSLPSTLGGQRSAARHE
jgi:hypothetical protein